VQQQTRLRPPSSLAHKKREASAAYTKSAEGCAGSGRCTFPASRRTCAPTIALQRSSWRRRSSRRAGSSGRRGRAGGAPGQHRRLFTHGKATYGFDVARLLPNRRFGTCWTSYCRLECYKLGRVAGFVDPKNGPGGLGAKGGADPRGPPRQRPGSPHVPIADANRTPPRVWRRGRALGLEHGRKPPSPIQAARYLLGAQVSKLASAITIPV
jgi:hypothetical protein